MGGSSFTHELSLDIKIGCIYALDWKARSKREGKVKHARWSLD